MVFAYINYYDYFQLCIIIISFYFEGLGFEQFDYVQKLGEERERVRVAMARKAVQLAVSLSGNLQRPRGVLGR